ncbi:MAG: GNAT family N-acetyltransferase [Alphaproteobacteria bacterium]|nr:GNAT family N-acetyltransferase [Alphaproteobacteria bacterium]
MTDWLLRPARDGDADDVIAVISRCFDLYPGCVTDVDGEMPELRRIASAYTDVDGAIWVIEQRSRVVALIGIAEAAARPGTGRGMEIHRLYVDPDTRRQGFGRLLLSEAERYAVTRGARFLEAWSDIRFTDAHRLYERMGYRRRPEIRILGDLSNSAEYHFDKLSLAEAASR